MKPSDVQLDLAPGAAAAPPPRGARGSRAAAEVGLQVIADLRRKVAARELRAAGPDAEPSPFLPGAVARCQLARDGEGKPLRDKSGAFLDPHEWRPAQRAGWLVCARCGAWMERDEPERAAARLAAARGDRGAR